MKEKRLILFDGVCNLCNFSVRFVIKHDPSSIFSFTTLQGETGLNIRNQYPDIPATFNSIILIDHGKAYTHSTAALKIIRMLNGPVRLLYGFIIVPPFLRDGVYNFIAKNRYKWFGKKNECMIPTPEIQSRFLN